MYIKTYFIFISLQFFPKPLSKVVASLIRDLMAHTKVRQKPVRFDNLLLICLEWEERESTNDRIES
jgi:hypothetical protein